MLVINIAKGESLFAGLDAALEAAGIPWKNMVRYATDSASVMVGSRNSVLSRVRQRQPNVFSLGCIYHLANLCAAAALKKLLLSIDGLLIDVFYHFKHSAKRWELFAEIQREFDDLSSGRPFMPILINSVMLRGAIPESRE